MCTWIYEQNWTELKQQMQAEDILQAASLRELGSDETGILEKLEYCHKEHIRLQLKKAMIDEELCEDLLTVLKQEETRKKQRLREAQQKGIVNALERKREGFGTYGRPRAEIPDDFEDRVREVKLQGTSLETYRRKTGLKRSTFYKYAADIKI